MWGGLRRYAAALLGSVPAGFNRSPQGNITCQPVGDLCKGTLTDHCVSSDSNGVLSVVQVPLLSRYTRAAYEPSVAGLLPLTERR